MKHEYATKIRQQIETAIVNATGVHSKMYAGDARRTVSAVLIIEQAERTLQDNADAPANTVQLAQLRTIEALLTDEATEADLVTAHMISYGLLMGR